MIGTPTVLSTTLLQCRLCIPVKGPNRHPRPGLDDNVMRTAYWADQQTNEISVWKFNFFHLDWCLLVAFHNALFPWRLHQIAWWAMQNRMQTKIALSTSKLGLHKHFTEMILGIKCALKSLEPAGHTLNLCDAMRLVSLRKALTKKSAPGLSFSERTPGKFIKLVWHPNERFISIYD